MLTTMMADSKRKRQALRKNERKDPMKKLRKYGHRQEKKLKITKVTTIGITGVSNGYLLSHKTNPTP